MTKDSLNMSPPSSTAVGGLTVVGSGIKFVGHMTLEAKGAIEHADKVFYIVFEPAIAEWLETLNPNTISLEALYEGPEKRIVIYQRIAETIANAAIGGEKVCAVFYGHPGVFVYASFEAIRLVKAKGLPAVMQPGISAEDCLFADCLIDPGRRGCQQYEATAFLVQQPTFDARTDLLLWQIAAIGNEYLRAETMERDSNAYLAILAEYLMQFYPKDHEVVVYIAAVYPRFDPSIRRVPLSQLPSIELTGPETLYVPAYGSHGKDQAMLDRLR